MICTLQGTLANGGTCTRLTARETCPCTDRTKLYVSYRHQVKYEYSFDFVPNVVCHSPTTTSIMNEDGFSTGKNFTGSLEFCKQKCAENYECLSISRSEDGYCVMGKEGVTYNTTCDGVYQPLATFLLHYISSLLPRDRMHPGSHSLRDQTISEFFCKLISSYNIIRLSFCSIVK